MSSIEKLKLKAKLLVKAKKKAGISFRLKDALDKVARLAGHASWRELRKSPGLEGHDAPFDDELYSRPTGVYPNFWCKTYEEARAVQNRNAGYFLLPYKKQFFVCPADHVEALGVAKEDPDLELAGRDWVSPLDAAALKRLRAKIEKR